MRGGGQPGDVLFNGTGTRLIGTRVGTSQTDSFTVGFDGRLTAAPGSPFTAIGASPYADQQTAPCWTIISPDGRYLFAVNTGSGTISRYAIAPGGQLALLGSTTVSATAGVGAVDPGLSPGGRYLFLNETRVDAVGAFAVSGGSLTELPSSPTSLPAGATPGRHRGQLAQPSARHRPPPAGVPRGIPAGGHRHHGRGRRSGLEVA